MTRRWRGRLALASCGPPLLVALVAGVFELLLAFGDDPRPRFLDRIEAGDGARFVRAKNAPTVHAKLRVESFTVAPAPGVTRVLCLGDSTMYGVPFEPPIPFADWLGLRLPHLLPGQSFEVLNLGASGMCSEDVLDLFRETGGAGASLLVVYVGHNEFLDYNLRRLRWPRAHAIRRALQRSRVGALLLDWTRRPSRSIAAETLDVRVAVRDEPFLTSEQLADGVARYGRNLELLIERAHALHLDVALCRPVSDPTTHAPYYSCFAATTPPAARNRFRIALQEVRADRGLVERAVADGEAVPTAALDRAFARLAEIESIDPAVAVVEWERGRLLLLRGEREAAKAAFCAALNRDGYPIRQRPSAAMALVGVAAARGAWLVDATPAFDAEAAPGLPDRRTLFVDDVHPARRGHELLADAVVRTLAAAGWRAPIAEWCFADEPSLDAYRELSGFDGAAQAAALARESFLLIGQSRFDRGARAALRAARTQIDFALTYDARCAEAHLANCALAAIEGDQAKALAEIELVRAVAPEIEATLAETWENVPEMRAAFTATGLVVADGRLRIGE
ncbi:MAG: hypothetical protein EXS13_07190 [Planctomycetes bacterium]|nr:hypothetical protein [Planctomycetota bacterium]